MHTPCDTSSDIQLPGAGRRRGRYSAAFKSSLVAACQQPGVSTAAIALANGINANLLRRWVNEERQAQALRAGEPIIAAASSDSCASGFVQLKPPAGPTAHSIQSTTPTAPDHPMQLHLSRGDLQVHLSMPAHQHAQCAALLKLILS